MNRFRILSHLLLSAGITLSLSCTGISSDGQGSQTGSGNEVELENGLIPETMKTELSEYFSGVLAGEGLETDLKAEMPIESIGSNTETVWTLWKDANANFTEQKLIDVSPLSEGNYGRWNLPEELEPSALMRYYFGTKGDRPEDGWPLYLYLHGSGDKDSEWANGLYLCSNFDDAPSLYFIPQIPNTGEWYRWWQQSKQYAWEKLFRLALASGDVNPDRLYLFGISEGGYGSQRLASFYADYLAAAGPMAGGEPLKNAPVENCANIAFSLRTGALDSGFFRNELTQCTLDEFDRLQAQHPDLYEHWIELIPGKGHSIDYYPTTPWLSEHVRNPWPKYFCWENFEMDGRYRDGFHNLEVMLRSNPDMSSRTVYEMKIDGNNISITVRNVTYETVESRDGIDLKFSKTYSEATSGIFRVYLNDKLVDLSKDVTLTVNGKTAFSGRLVPDVSMMARSCALFGDPQRIFPCGIDVDLSTL